MLTPLRQADGRVIFVDRGFVPADLKDPAKRAAGQLAGTVRVDRPASAAAAAKPSWFLPDNRPERNFWFWIDLPAMAAADRLSDVAPFYIVADATPNPGGWPKGSETAQPLPNNHLQYAITWFALARRRSSSISFGGARPGRVARSFGIWPARYRLLPLT